MSDSEWEDDDLVAPAPSAAAPAAPAPAAASLKPEPQGPSLPPAPSSSTAHAHTSSSSSNPASSPAHHTAPAPSGAGAALAPAGPGGRPLVKSEIPAHERSRIATELRIKYLKDLDELEAAALKAMEKEMQVTAIIAAMSAQFVVGATVDLNKLVAYAPNAEIDKKRRPNVHIRVRNPHCSVQVNPSGFVSILGGLSRSELYRASRLVATMIKRSGACPEARLQSFLINNIVLSCKTGKLLRRDLVEVQLQKLGIDAYSEQEIFPCVRVNLHYPKKHSVKVFRTGAFIVMGLTEIADSILSFKTFYDIIEKLPKTATYETVSFGRFQARDLAPDYDPDAVTSASPAAAGLSTATRPLTSGVGGAEAPRLNYDEYAATAEVKEEEDFTLEHMER